MVTSSTYGSWLHPLILLTILVIAVPLSSVAQNISINDSLTATDTSSPWRSPNGDFAFGFQQLQGNPNLFILSIWFDRVPEKTIVWYERSSYPVPRGSTLQLQARDGLLLRNPQGSPLYTTSNDISDVVANAFMQDNGNFVLTGTNSSNILWESFRHLVDTILPTQAIEINEMLISPRTRTDLAQGRFRAIMNSSGNFFFSFKTVRSNEDFDALYYSSQSRPNENAPSSSFRVRFDEAASIYVETRDGRVVTNLSSPLMQSSQNYYRASLDFDGIFTLYYHPKVFEGNPRWTVQRAWPSDPNDVCKITIRMGSGTCGYNSICSIQSDRPVCNCPMGFSLADPNNTQGDCKSDYEQNCIQSDEGGEECSLTEVPNVNWPMYTYELVRATTEQGCKDACLKDYFCSAAVLGGSNCWKKSLPITNGKYERGPKTFLKRGKLLNQTQDHAPIKPAKEKKLLVLIVVGSVILGSSVLVNLFLTSAACFGFFPKVKFPVAVGKLGRDSTGQGTNLRCFTYRQLVQATGGFKEELGRGAFGIVYNGVMTLDDSRATAVAVKKLDRVAQESEKEFRTEVNVIGRIHHKNVVRLLGFCDEGTNRLLVYEHMPNGNLANFLFNDVKPLSWRQRTEIALGIARGLAYLHEECSPQIIHCDVKPQNILLDEYYTARISDFGLAKLLMLDQSRTLTNIRGTKGYVSPEWFRNTQITTKVDVYSFGVVLLEIISCRKSVLADMEFGGTENPILTDWAWQCFLEGTMHNFVEYDEEGSSNGEMAERFVKVGLWCIQEDAGVRPTMRRACQMLEGTVHVAVPPFPSSSTCISTQL